MAVRFMLIMAALVLATSCTPTYEDRGTGQELYSRQTPVATNNLASYFYELCAQANLIQSGSPATCSDYPTLVQVGFNDIDLRCDRYLAWIDNKRTEAVRVKSSLAAVGIAVTGILATAKAGTDSIAYVAEALGLANALYDAYSNTLLLGLESSTIKRIVYERRLEFRRQFSKVSFFRTPEMVFALRGYLRICTPQTIILDANTYALAVASGTQPQSLAASVQQEIDAIAAGQAPLQPQTSAGQKVDRGKVTCAECDKLFPPGSGYTTDRIKAAQTALCLEADGKVGEGTLSAVQHYRTTQRSDATGVVRDAEYSDILTEGCKAGDREKGIRNFYEAVMSRNPNELPTFAKNLNKLLPAAPQLDPNKVTFNSEDLRRKVVDARNRYGMTTVNDTLATHITGALVDKVALDTLN